MKRKEECVLIQPNRLNLGEVSRDNYLLLFLIPLTPIPEN